MATDGPTPTAVDHSLAGTGGSVLALALVYPLDTVRTRLQAEESSAGHKSPLQMIADIVEKEGVASLYKGLGGNLKIVGFSQAIYFFWYNTFKKAVEKVKGKEMSVVENLALAYIAGAINVTCTCPLWAVATRMKLPSEGDEKKKPGVVDILKDIVEKEGVKGLYKGMGPSLALCTNPAIQFLVYEQLKKRFASSGAPSGGAAFMMGAAAKAVATVLTYPIQVLQTREQKGGSHKALGMALVKAILEKEGVGGFYKGMSSKLLQTVLNSALLFVIYEKLLRGVMLVTKR